MCGGTLLRHRPLHPAPGLSPRVRGNRRPTYTRCGCPGSIPACAGEPLPRRAAEEIAMVYPRVCGGTGMAGDGLYLLVGLSPRVRGNPWTVIESSPRIGSIPACAGEPWIVWPTSPGSGVYPRVCGGTSPCRKRRGRRRGLSPRVRGNPLHRAGVRGLPGSIPACAGEPVPRIWRASRSGVYPRVCGGTHKVAPDIPHRGGLSPRVRGNPKSITASVTALRSIPACAGEPWTPRPTAVCQAVYPRVCGGTMPFSMAKPRATGLSPRVRGNRPDYWIGGRHGRSIPACAGEPHQNIAGN